MRFPIKILISMLLLLCLLSSAALADEEVQEPLELKLRPSGSFTTEDGVYVIKVKQGTTSASFKWNSVGDYEYTISVSGGKVTSDNPTEGTTATV